MMFKLAGSVKHRITFRRALGRGALLSLIAVVVSTVQHDRVSARDVFDVAAFKEEIVDAGEDANQDAFVKQLFDAAKDLEQDPEGASALVDGLIASIDMDAADQPAGRTYVRIVARHLAGIGLWPSDRPRVATDRLGGLADRLRGSDDQADVSLALLLDDVVSRAPNMYIKLLRNYTPTYNGMRHLVEDKVEPLLDISYVRSSKYFHYIRAMLAAKYAELALFNADYAAPLCSNRNTVNRDHLGRSNKYAEALLKEIDGDSRAELPLGVVRVRNDLIYQLALNAILACEREPANRLIARLHHQPTSEDGSGDIADHVYVFRHVRTKRKFETVERERRTRDGRIVSESEVIPDQSDVKRKFYNPKQLAAQLCRAGLGVDSVTIAGLKASLDAFENVDFWVDISGSGDEGIGDERDQLEAVRQGLRKYADELAKTVPAFASPSGGRLSPASLLRRPDETEGRCDAFRSQRRASSLNVVLATPAISPVSAELSSRKAPARIRLGGSLSAEEARSLAEGLRQTFPDWSIRIGRPDILD